MARLKAHGTELARRETPTGRIAVMSDGNIMRNHGTGWKLWRKLKAGVDAVEYAAKFKRRTEEIPQLVRDYIDCLVTAVDLEHRARLHTTITLMPNDPDGVWSEFDDWAGYQPDYADVAKACMYYQLAQSAIRDEHKETVGE